MQDTNLNWLILAMIQMRVLRMWTRLSMVERVLPFNLVILIDMSVLVGLITNYTIIIIMSFCVCVCFFIAMRQGETADAIRIPREWWACLSCHSTSVRFHILHASMYRHDADIKEEARS